MRKAGQTLHYVARKALESRSKISPAELAKLLGCHYQKATKLLLSLGWYRRREKSHPYTVYYYKDEIP